MITIDPKVLSYDKRRHLSYETFIVSSLDDSAVVEALARAAKRFMWVDETGAEHLDQDAAEDAYSDGLYTPNYVSDPRITPRGVRLYVDCKGSIEDPMGEAMRAILREELERVVSIARVVAV